MKKSKPTEKETVKRNPEGTRGEHPTVGWLLASIQEVIERAGEEVLNYPVLISFTRSGELMRSAGELDHILFATNRITDEKAMILGTDYPMNEINDEMRQNLKNQSVQGNFTH
jgi:hypothetical protein